MSDIASTSMAASLPRKSRGANPSTDYKALFLKSKDKYDRVSSEHTELKASVVKAAAKHQKLREELDYLLDAVAAKRDQRAQIEQSHRQHALVLEREAAAAVAAAEAARRRAGSTDRQDRGAYEARSGNRGYEGEEEYRPYASRYAQPSYHAFGSGIGRGYASSPPPPIQPAAASGAASISVLSQRGGNRYTTSEASPQGPERRGSYATSSYRQAPLRSPPAPLASSSSRRLRLRSTIRSRAIASRRHRSRPRSHLRLSRGRDRQASNESCSRRMRGTIANEPGTIDPLILRPSSSSSCTCIVITETRPLPGPCSASLPPTPTTS